MNRLFVILCLTVAPAFALWELGYEVTFGMDPLLYGKSSFVPMPQYLDEAVAKGWVNTTKPEAMAGYELLTMMCPPKAIDRVLCLHFDDTGFIAGQQLALVVDNIAESTYDLLNTGYKTWKDTVDGITTTYYTLTHYYITPEELAIPAATRLAERNNTIIVQKNLVLPGYNGTSHIISTDTKKLTSRGFTKQGCFNGMGTHYYYKMTTTLECTEDKILPFFLLEHNGQVIGLGWSLFAKYTVPDGGLNPFEIPTISIMKINVPRAPQCVYDYGSSPGMLTMHTYFIADGYLISC